MGERETPPLLTPLIEEGGGGKGTGRRSTRLTVTTFWILVKNPQIPQSQPNRETSS